MALPAVPMLGMAWLLIVTLCRRALDTKGTAWQQLTFLPSRSSLSQLPRAFCKHGWVPASSFPSGFAPSRDAGAATKGWM